MSKERRDGPEDLLDRFAGRINEAAGAMTRDKTLEAEGRADQRRAGRKTYRVMSAAEGWRVEAEDASRASSVHKTKDEAVRKARELARSQEPSQLIVYKKDGTAQTDQAYG